MTRQAKSDRGTQILTETLELEKLEENLFRGLSPDVGWQRVFGGQVIAQALVASQRTVPNDRHVHSLHAYFMRPGDPSIPIIYEVDRIRDGHSFTTRRVVAIQHGKAIFSLSASFQTDEDGFEHQIEMPDIPGPQESPGEEALLASYLEDAPQAVKNYWTRPRPIELRPVNMEDYFQRKSGEPVQRIWVRATGPAPESRQLQAALLAYLSDMTLLDTSLYAHGTSVFDSNIQAASLDHAMWFHRPADLSDWMLYTQDSPSAQSARGMTRGSLFSRDGTLIATVAQEGLIRRRAND